MARIESVRPWRPTEMISSLKERKGKERREEREEEKETRKPRRDGSVRKEQTMEFPFAFGYVWNGREGGGPGWKKDGEDESEALQLGGVVSN